MTDVADLEALLPSLSPAEQAIAQKLLATHSEAQRKRDALIAAGAPAGTLTESPAHIAWRTARVASLTGIDAIAAELDGNAATPNIAADLEAGEATIRKRLEALKSLPTGQGVVVSEALEALRNLAREPLFYVSDYYRRFPTQFDSGGNPIGTGDQIGPAEQALADALAAVAAFLELQP